MTQTIDDEELTNVLAERDHYILAAGMIQMLDLMVDFTRGNGDRGFIEIPKLFNRMAAIVKDAMRASMVDHGTAYLHMDDLARLKYMLQLMRSVDGYMKYMDKMQHNTVVLHNYAEEITFYLQQRLNELSE